MTENLVLYDPLLPSVEGLTGGVCFDSDSDAFVTTFGHVSGGGSIYGNKLVYRVPLPVVLSGVSCRR